MAYGGSGRRPPPDISGMTSLKVDNVGRRTTPDELYRLFDKFGEIGDVHIPRDGRSGESRGYAFVRFPDRRDAEDAADRLNDTMFNGRRIGVCHARYDRPREEKERDSYRHRDRRSPARHRSRSPERKGSRSRSRSREKRRSSSASKSKSRSRSRSKT